MKIYGLKKLYVFLKKHNKESCKFEYKIRDDVIFDVFYTISHEPNEILFGLKGSKKFAFLVEVHKGWEVTPFLENSIYKDLVEILFKGENSGNVFKPFQFFKLDS
jgi:hypothetical protein